MDNTKQQMSVLIKNLRLPMTIGIVFIHTHFRKYIAPDTLSQLTAFNIVSFGITNIFCQLFVPAFFIISGFLFFKEKTLTRQLYTQKLKRRFFTLVIPYIFWNAIVLLVMYLQQRFLATTSPRLGNLSDYNLTDWIYAFIDDRHNHSVSGILGQPASVQFWFIRDLIFICVISPLIFYLVRFNKWLSLIVLTAVYFAPWHVPPQVHSLSYFYFGLGVWIQLYDIDIITLEKKYRPLCIILATIGAAGICFFKQYDNYMGLKASRLLFIISGLLILAGLVSRLTADKGELLPEKISKSNFFIFAYHIVPTAILCQLTCRVLPINSFTLIAAYLTIPFIVTVVGIITYMLLIRFFPRLTKIMTGGR